MSNLIKSGFVAFAEDNTLVIDANENKIIKGIDSAIEEAAFSKEDSVEEAIAEAMLEDADIEGLDISDINKSLTIDTSKLPELSEDISGDAQMVSDDIIASAKKEAEAIVSRAHDEAEQLRGQAYDEAEAIKQQAKEEGYQTGYDEGKTAGLQEHDALNKELNERIENMEQELTDKKEELIKDTEKHMVDWLCQMIPRITGVMIDEEKDVLLYMINESLREQEESHHFVIRVSSKDYPEISERKEEIYGALNPSVDLEVFEDAKLDELRCMIETDNGVVDISLDTQLNNLTKALRLMVKE